MWLSFKTFIHQEQYEINQEQFARYNLKHKYILEMYKIFHPNATQHYLGPVD